MTKKNNGKKASEPWKGVMTKEDYDKVTSKMSPASKKNFDADIASRNTNCLMSLGASGLFEPKNRQMAKDGEKPLKKNFAAWWDR